MSESSNMVLRRNPKHVKGKYSMSKPSYLISIDNENIINNHTINKSNNNNTSSQNIKETKLSVKGMNNKSFVLRTKKVKEINEKFDKISFNKLSYKVGKSFVNSNKKTSMKPNKNNLEKKVQNPIHTRIKSFQVELKDNYFSNNISKTERNNYKENISTNRNKIKKKKLNELEYTYNEYSTINNNNFNKTTVFEDIEESTKNTKLFDQKIETLDNISSDEKYLILSDRNPKKDKNTLKNKKSKENNNNNNNKKFKRLGNMSNLNSNKNKFNNSFHRRNRAFSPTMKNQLNDIRKNIFENKEPAKRDSTPLNNKNNNEKRSRDTKETKDIEEGKEVKEIEHRKKISNLIQKIKNKIQINQIIKNEYNSNTVRNAHSKNMSFVRERKTISNSF